ncbi:MAG: hypothetical protein LBJ69_00015 [Holosporales bacterium]|jgi:hypothetical protein|nr:hypothetical protein [Holosporales bacterium]
MKRYLKLAMATVLVCTAAQATEAVNPGEGRGVAQDPRDAKIARLETEQVRMQEKLDLQEERIEQLSQAVQGLSDIRGQLARILAGQVAPAAPRPLFAPPVPSNPLHLPPLGTIARLCPGMAPDQANHLQRYLAGPSVEPCISCPPNGRAQLRTIDADHSAIYLDNLDSQGKLVTRMLFYSKNGWGQRACTIRRNRVTNIDYSVLASIAYVLSSHTFNCDNNERNLRLLREAIQAIG